MDIFLQLVVSGLALGAVYSLVALGFVLVFKSTGILNFAHGEFLMVGSYLALTFLSDPGLDFVSGTIVVAVLMALGGALLYYVVMRPLIGEPVFSVVLLTLGLAIILRAIILMAYGPLERGKVSALPEGTFTIGGATVSYVDVTVFGVAVAAVLVFLLFFRFTRLGLQMRAVAENLEAAAAMGINVNRIFASAWALSALMAGIGGVLYSNFTSVISVELSAIGLRAFPAALVGGLDSVGGAILGGLVIGVVEQLGAGYLGTEWRDVIAFGVMFIVLMVRPYGFFGKKELIRV